MNLGFYYHIPFALKDNKIALPGYLGIFIETLAARVEKLIFIGNQTRFNAKQQDYIVASDNIEYIDLGTKSHAILRTIFGRFGLLKHKKKIIASCNTLLVRCPSPLAANIKTVFGRKINISYLVVGSYKEGATQLQGTGIKILLLKWYYLYSDYKLARAIKGTSIFTNSEMLKLSYTNIAKQVTVISTATIRKNDFFERKDTCENSIITILYVGRYDFAKGIKELLEAFLILFKKRDDICLKLAGWDDSRNQVVIDYMNSFVLENKLTNKVFIVGKLKYGAELSDAYRCADLFVMPSHHEGFPRAIYEAQANSLPVIATRVGAIPYNLKNGEDCILIEPKSATQLVDAIELVIDKPDLRRKIIAKGFRLIENLVLDKQVDKLIDILNKQLSPNNGNATK